MNKKLGEISESLAIRSVFAFAVYIFRPNTNNILYVLFKVYGLWCIFQTP